MTALAPHERIYVVNNHVIRLIVETDDVPHSLRVIADVDGRRVRSWEEPGWRNIALGAFEALPYWWSARRLVVLPLRPPDEPTEVEADEDILFAFGRPEGWLLVCETSVRLIEGVRGEEYARLEFGEVIADCRPTETQLTVIDVSGSEHAIDIQERRLRLVT